VEDGVRKKGQADGGVFTLGVGATAAAAAAAAVGTDHLTTGILVAGVV
jgi:hypothetical protein